jgi:ribose-phosphate pyrophosphokinase
MISTGGTIAEGVATLLEAGALPDITVAATHGLLLERVRNRLGHPGIQALFVTDSVAIPPMGWPQLHIVSIAPLLAQAIQRCVADGAIDESG